METQPAINAMTGPQLFCWTRPIPPMIEGNAEKMSSRIKMVRMIELTKYSISSASPPISLTISSEIIGNNIETMLPMKINVTVINKPYMM